jgi:predicted dehydrogenase
MRSMQKKLKVAIVGLGKMGLVHASILNTLPDVELVALCDTSSFVRKFCSNLLLDIAVVEDVAKLSDFDVDIVYITSPIPSHYLIVKKICSFGKPVSLFVEKTLSSKYEDTLALCSMVRECKSPNMVGYMKRFAVTFNKAKELLLDNAIGSILSFEGHAYSSDFFGVDETSQMSLKRGGVLSDLGSHVIDLALWFFGDFQVQPIKSVPTDFQNTVQFKVRSNSAIEGSFDVSWCKEGYHVPEFGLVINGSTGKIAVDDDVVTMKPISGQTTHWFRQDLKDNVGFLLGAPEYYREDEYFVKSILKGIYHEPSFDSASKVDFIIGKVLEGVEKK